MLLLNQIAYLETRYDTRTILAVLKVSPFTAQSLTSKEFINKDPWHQMIC